MNNLHSKANILIVDDTPENLDVLKNALIEDYMVRPAISGQLALRLANMAPQPDLILLDIMMPEMDGYEVCRRLKRDPRTQDIPIIFVTAKTTDQDELTGLQLGAVDYITKPISPSIVQLRVRTQLALLRYNQDMEEKNRRLYEINERLTNSMEQLSASEDRFRSLVQTIPDIVYKIDSEGCFIFLNKSIERLGYHQSDLIGKHFTEIIHSADIPHVSLDQVVERIGKGTVNPEQKVFDERRTGVRMTVGLQVRLKTKFGSVAGVVEIKNIEDETIPVEVNSTGLFGEVGQDTLRHTRQYVGTVGVIRDVTDRNKVQKAFMEERMLLRQLINAVPLPIFFVEGDGTLIFSNEALRHFVGVGEEQLEGANLNALFGEEEKNAIHPMLSDLFNDPTQARTRQEVAITCGNNKRYDFTVILSKFERSEHKKPAIIGVLVDITEQKMMFEKLVEARQQAETMAVKAAEASQAKGNFLANMSHEIRTPLNAVIGLTHLCLQTPLNIQQQDYLTKVSMSANALLSLLNDILDFSKIEAGKLSMEKISFSLDDVLDGVVAIMSVKCQEKGLELLIDTQKNVPRYLEGDSHRLGQIFTNLVGNAIKFTECGEIIIRSEVLEETPEDTLLQFSVSDTGIGMSDKQMGDLFQEFSQGDASITRKFGGTGLGLAISKRLVTMMGGQIRVESNLDRGSCFQFSAKFGKINHPRQKPMVIEESICSLNILIVDDNDVARRILTEQLEAVGYHPVGVDSGEKATETIQSADATDTPFDLVLMDWKMPGMDGMETSHHIKEKLSLNVPPKIIMVTAYGQEGGASAPMIQGVLDGFLMKPITTAVLLDAILVAFGHSPTGCVPDRLSSTPSSLAGASILLVEDNEINQQVAKELLEKMHIHVTVAKNGLEAVEMTQKETFDAILMDMQMPVMDGLTATQRIREKEPDQEILPIIAMTANAMADDRDNCLKAGMNDYVAKPVIPEALYSVLSRWVSGKSSFVSDEKAVFSHKTGAGSPVLFSLLYGIESSKGLRNVGGDAVLFKNVLLKFARNQGESCARMARALEGGDSVSLEQAAHALKGVAATIGATKLSELARAIENIANTPEGFVKIPPLLEETKEISEKILSSIRSVLIPAHDVDDDGLNQEEVTVGPGVLSPLFKEAMQCLNAFDSSVEDVVKKMGDLALNPRQKRKMHALEAVLDTYDFETCLTLLNEWADEEGISLDE